LVFLCATSVASGQLAATMVDILAKLKGVRRSGEGWTAKCPVHEDKHNSLSVHHREGKWLIKCHAGCSWDTIIAAIGVTPAFESRWTVTASAGNPAARLRYTV
jgi:hypothetical protein